MTVVDALIELAGDACPSYFVTWGFEVDLVSLLEKNTIPGPVVYIGVGPQIPDGGREDGRCSRFVETFSVFLARNDHVTQADTATYTEFLALRDACNGAAITADGRKRIVMIAASDPGESSGELTLQVL